LSLLGQAPKPSGNDWATWGRALVDFIETTKSKLRFYLAGDSAAEEGVLLWDRTGYPVISKNGAYAQILLAGGSGQFTTDTSQTAAANNTPYQLPLSGANLDGLSLSGNDVVVSEAGTLNVTATASNDVYLWFEVNGVNTKAVFGKVIDCIVTVQANQTIKAYWASSGNNLTTQAAGALPAIPAYQLTIKRINQ